MIRGTKKPALASWKEFQERHAGDDELKAWFGGGSHNGIAIVTGIISGIAVVDMDSPEVVEFAKSHNFPPTPLVRTGKGYHAYYKYSTGMRNFQKLDGRKYSRAQRSKTLCQRKALSLKGRYL